MPGHFPERYIGEKSPTHKKAHGDDLDIHQALINMLFDTCEARESVRVTVSSSKQAAQFEAYITDVNINTLGGKTLGVSFSVAKVIDFKGNRTKPPKRV